MNQISMKHVILAVAIMWIPQSTSAQNLAEFEKNVTEFTLDNGLTVIILKRDVAPVASFVTYVGVGGANEPVGQTGIAHIFEHMAFKGTTTIGTSDWEKEKPLLEAVNTAYKTWLREKSRPNADTAAVRRLWIAFKAAEEQAKTYVVNNEFSQIIDRAGGVGLNAFTSSDETGYFYSLPQNKAELWFTLEAARFKDPVFREFYVEKDVVKEERRMRTDSNPIGRLIEEFLAVAYSAHPYKNPVVGWPSDIEAVTMDDALAFYSQFYVPSNMIVSIAGDVDPAQMRAFAQTYFGDLAKGEPAPTLMVKEPQQRGERRFVIEEESQPFFISGYRAVEATHPDASALEILSDILSSGRTSRLYKRLVEQDKLALEAAGFYGFPGTKYQTLFVAYAVPNQGVSIDSIETAMEEELETIRANGVTHEELSRAITQRRANLIRSLSSNNGLALSLAQNQSTYGDWRALFRNLNAMTELTPADIQRVAQTYLVKSQRTVGIIQTSEGINE
jgi:predicted Zn-dependent peptidase